jgi:Ca2+-binding RTX toxin-like protein
MPAAPAGKGDEMQARFIGLVAAVVVAVVGLGTAQVADAAPAANAKQKVKVKVKRDTLRITGTDDADVVALRLRAGDPERLEVDVGDDGSADFDFKRKRIDRILVEARDGDDLVRIDEANGVFTDVIPTTLDGGDGNDTLLGGSGAERLLGGDGDDFADGNRGNDLGLMGDGDDTFRWDPGDGNDTIEGQDGLDVMDFNGANIADTVDMSANGGRLRFFRQPGTVTMDTNDVERVDFHALGGTDTVTVNDLSGTDVTEVRHDLAAALGGDVADGQLDSVIVNGTNGDDTIEALGQAGNVSVTGLHALVRILHADATDQLALNGLAGDDTLSAATLPADAIRLTEDGGADDDRMLGGAGADVMLAGDGNDFADGNRGDDSASMGAGDDTFQWDPGDGNDTIEGQDGIDLMDFNGANIADTVDMSANGGRLRFFRQPGNVTMDTNDLERVNFDALGGADTVVVNDLSGTDVKEVNNELEGTPGSGDNAPDSLIVNGTNGADSINVAGSAANVAVTGLAAAVTAEHAEAANDSLSINALAGADVVNASGLAADTIKLAVDGGDDGDIIIGSAGNDAVDGGRADDSAFLGAGDDSFRWDPGEGSDVVEGQAGTDTLDFNGANVDEKIDVSANGPRVRFFRNVATITMDLNDVERIDFDALGGVDNVVVHDLSGTDARVVNVDLAGTLGGNAGDGQADSVTATGTNGDDAIAVAGSAGSVSVTGIAASVNIRHAESALDALTVDTLAGTDTVDTAGLAPNTIQLTVI